MASWGYGVANPRAKALMVYSADSASPSSSHFATMSFWGCQHWPGHPQELRRRRHRRFVYPLALNHLVDQADAVRFAGVDDLAGEQHLPRSAQPHRWRQQRRLDHRRQTHPDLRQTEDRVSGCDADVGGQGQLQRAAQTRPLYRGHHRRTGTSTRMRAARCRLRMNRSAVNGVRSFISRRSTPAENARSPAPRSTMARTFVSLPHSSTLSRSSRNTPAPAGSGECGPRWTGWRCRRLVVPIRRWRRWFPCSSSFLFNPGHAVLRQNSLDERLQHLFGALNGQPDHLGWIFPIEEHHHIFANIVAFTHRPAVSDAERFGVCVILRDGLVIC